MSQPESSRRRFLNNLAIGTAVLPLGVGASPSWLATAEIGTLLPESLHSVEAHQVPPTPFVFKVTDFGAVPGGKVLCTKSIQAAIDACSAAGGGKVVVPPGTYLTAPLFPKSNMTFEVASGATLLATTNFAEYPSISGRWEGIDRTVYASLLTGEGVENICITGGGTLDGQGAIWWDVQHKINATRRQLGLEGREPDNPPGSALKWPRPRMINFYRSRNVRISGITLQNSPSWSVHPVLCQDVFIQGIRILSPRDTLNTDGIDPDSCRNVLISDCYISTGDDCIVIKSGYRYQPGHPYPPSENIVIANCVFGFGQGGVVIGSETAGGVRNVVATNCVCDGTRRGLYFKTARGRGNVIEDIRVTNFICRNLVDTGIVISMFYNKSDRAKTAALDEFTPTMRLIYCSNITINGAKRSVVIEGLPENPIQSLELSDVRIISAGSGAQCSEVNGMQFENFVSNPDVGPPVSVESVRDLQIIRVRTEKSYPGQAVMHLDRVERAIVQGCSGADGNIALLELQGTGNKEIALALNRPPKGARKIVFSGGASEDAVAKLS